MRICSTCGSVNAQDSKYCRKCGAPLATPASPVRVKTASRPPAAAKPAKSAPFTTPPLEPIPPAVDDNIEGIDAESAVETKPSKEAGPNISWRPPQQAAVMQRRQSQGPAQVPTSNPPLPSESPEGSPEQVAPLIPIRPRPVEDLSITDKVRFYKPPGGNPPLQGVPAEEFRPHVFGASPPSQKLIPLSEIATKLPATEKSGEDLATSSQVPGSGIRRASSYSSDTFTKIMTDTLQNLSQQLGMSRATSKKVIAPQVTAIEQQVEPQTLSDILLELSHIDPNIEASSLVRQDGTILAAASSRRLDDNLIATIAGTLSTISSDIIGATEAGKHKYTAIHGTQGILFIAPLLQDIYLIVFTSPLSRPGVINVATHRVKAQLKKYLGLK